MNDIELSGRVKSVNANMVKRVITVTLEVPFDDYNLGDAEELAGLVQPGAGAVEITISPRQMSMKFQEQGTSVAASVQADAAGE